MQTIGKNSAAAELERIGESHLDHLQEQAVAVVLIGELMPKRLGVDELVRLGLLPEGHSAPVRVEVDRPDLARFSSVGLTFDATPDRMVITARAEPFIRLMDMVRSAAEHMAHGDLHGMVFVYAFQFRVKDSRQQHILGRQLAPLQAWGETAGLFESGSSSLDGGLASLTLQQAILDENPGILKITVQPSHPAIPGIGVSMQMERSFARTDMSVNEEWYAQSCIDRYDSTMRMCKGIAKRMMDHARSL